LRLQINKIHTLFSHYFIRFGVSGLNLTPLLQSEDADLRPFSPPNIGADDYVLVDIAVFADPAILEDMALLYRSPF